MIKQNNQNQIRQKNKGKTGGRNRKDRPPFLIQEKHFKENRGTETKEPSLKKTSHKEIVIGYRRHACARAFEKTTTAKACMRAGCGKGESILTQVLLAVIPIAWLIIAMTLLKMSGVKACGIGLVITAAECLAVYKMGVPEVVTGAAEGAIAALWPICIIIETARKTPADHSRPRDTSSS